MMDDFVFERSLEFLWIFWCYLCPNNMSDWGFDPRTDVNYKYIEIS